jgi:hypothetical protein
MIPEIGLRNLIWGGAGCLNVFGKPVAGAFAGIPGIPI